FFVRRNLHELNAPLAPVPQRLDPVAWPQVEVRLGVLVMSRISIALHKTEAVRVLVHEPVDAQRVWVDQRAPRPLAGSGLCLEAVTVMYFGAVIVKMPPR